MSSFDCYYEYECGRGCRRKDKCDWDDDEDCVGPQGPQGPPGRDGQNGVDGNPGAPGVPGQDGASSSSQIALPWSDTIPPVNAEVGDFVYMLTDGTITNQPHNTTNEASYLFGGNAIGILPEQNSPHVSLEEFYSSYVDEAIIESVDWDIIPVGVATVPGRRLIGGDPSGHNISPNWVQIPFTDLQAPAEIINALPGSYMYLTGFN